jgi:hypothetical protein
MKKFGGGGVNSELFFGKLGHFSVLEKLCTIIKQSNLLKKE